MEQLNIKHECKRYGCAVLAATVFAINIKTFVRAGGLYPGGVSGLTLLIQNIFAQFLGLQIPYTVINILLNSIPVYVGFRFYRQEVHHQLLLCDPSFQCAYRPDPCTAYHL